MNKTDKTNLLIELNRLLDYYRLQMTFYPGLYWQGKIDATKHTIRIIESENF